MLLVFSAHPTMVKGQENNEKGKVILIPLDDRPVCLQLPTRMGDIGDLDIITPPIEMLGRYTTPGDTHKLSQWLLSQELEEIQAVIISLDMLVYGGLVASRVHNVAIEQALENIQALERLKERRPDMPLYVNSVIMRLAPTVDENNEDFREPLAAWAEVSVMATEEARAKTKKLEEIIPLQVLADYKRARRRNLQINMKSLELVGEGIIDYLIISQDDAKPEGVHVVERNALIAKVKKENLGEQVAVQPGADEISMLLLARLLYDKKEQKPGIKVIYSSNEMSETAMPFEDRPLKETVNAYIEASGSKQVEKSDHADLFFYIYTSREEENTGTRFAKKIRKALDKGQRVIVADVDPVGNIQGGDVAFTKALERENILPRLYGYASWNTAGNTLGTALPQGLIYHYSIAGLEGNEPKKRRVLSAQSWFTFHRVLNDFYYNNIVRNILLKKDEDKYWSSVLSETQSREMEIIGASLMQDKLDHLYHNFTKGSKNNSAMIYDCRKPTNLEFLLPWNRLFEAHVDFKMHCNH